MSTHYTNEKFLQAVHCLIADGSLADRLFYTGMYLIRLDQSDAFPTRQLRARFGRIHAQLTQTPARGDEGSLRASVDAMTDDQRQKLSQEIFDVFLETEEAYHLENVKRGLKPTRAARATPKRPATRPTRRTAATNKSRK